MTSDEYVARGGSVCPVCGSDDIDGGFVEIDNGYAIQEVGCLACNASWDDVYKMTGYANLQTTS